MSLKYFKDEEFRCHCGCGAGIEMMQEDFLKMLEDTRELVGIPFILNSAYRCPAHNKAIGSKSDNHPSGQAVDIKCLYSVTRYNIVTSALKVGFKRIGLHRKFIHLDNRVVIPVASIWFY